MDYDIETFKNGESTGFNFKVQLKSSAVSNYSADGDFISQELTLDQAEYLAEQQIAPTVLIHADVTANRLYWNAVQLDTALRKVIAARTTKSTTVRISSKNVLPETMDALLAALIDAQKILAVKTLYLSESAEFVDLMRRQQVLDSDQVIKTLQEKAQRLQLYRAHDLFREGKAPEAKAKAEALINGADVPIELRFSAVLQVERIEYSAAAKSAPAQMDLATLTLRTAERLWKISRDGTADLKFYALIAKTAAKLSVLIATHVGLGMNWQVNEQYGNPLWRMELAQKLNHNLVEIGFKYRQCLRLARYVSRSIHRAILSAAVTRIGREVPNLAAILDSTGASELAAQYRRSGFEIFKLAAAIAEEIENLDDYVEAITLALMLEPSEQGEIQEWTRSMIDRIADAQHKERAEWFYDRWLRRKLGEAVEGDVAGTTEQSLKNMANALGIDVTDPKLVALLETELKDANPSRVLESCAHIFTSLAPQPKWIINLGLRHAGPKTVHCTLHNWHVTGRDLDTAYAQFKAKYCDACSDRKSRPADWSYSAAWLLEENERQRDFIDRFRAGF